MFRVQGSGFRVQVSGFRVQVFGFRAGSLGLRVHGWGFEVGYGLERPERLKWTRYSDRVSVDQVRFCCTPPRLRARIQLEGFEDISLKFKGITWP